MDGWMEGWRDGCECKLNARIYLLLIGTERCCDVAAVGVWFCARVCVCVCGGDGCVGDTTNACTMYRVMGIRLAGRMYVL